MSETPKEFKARMSSYTCPPGYEYVRAVYHKDGTYVHSYCREIARRKGEPNTKLYRDYVAAQYNLRVERDKKREEIRDKYVDDIREFEKLRDEAVQKYRTEYQEKIAIHGANKNDALKRNDEEYLEKMKKLKEDYDRRAGYQ